MADIEAFRKSSGIRVSDLCQAVKIDRQQYQRHRESGRIWLDRANAMIDYIEKRRTIDGRVS